METNSGDNYQLQEKKNAKTVFTARETKMCVASFSAIAEEFSFLFFLSLSNYRRSLHGGTVAEMKGSPRS